MQVETEEYVFFWRPDSIFSNWHEPATCRLEHETFLNSEAAFIYLKACTFSDVEACFNILQYQDKGPAYVKSLGRQVKNFDERRWLSVRKQCMYKACYAKFSQNEELKKALLATGNKTLVEASPYDRIWGIGLRPDDPKALDPANWRGLNLLGQVLMEVRNELNAG